MLALKLTIHWNVNKGVFMINIKNISSAMLAILFSLGFISTGYADNSMITNNPNSQKTVMVGGAAMYPSKNIVENAANAKDLTTLVAAVKAAGLIDTLSGQGPFTVFAPTNAAFDKLPSGTVSTLIKPENKAKLVSVLTYHVIPGKISAEDLLNKIKAGGGQTSLKTVEGENLNFKLANGEIEIIDSRGDKATITNPDVFQSNGVVHVIDTVLIP